MDNLQYRIRNNTYYIAWDSFKPYYKWITFNTDAGPFESNYDLSEF